LSGTTGQKLPVSPDEAKIYDLMERLETRGAHIYIPRGDEDYAIDVGLRMLTLRHLVRQEQGLFLAEPAELPLLTYYANTIAHLFGEPPARGFALAPQTPALPGGGPA